jgi:hypothetical protein
MSQLAAYLTVFVAAAIPWLEVLLVVPAGIVAGLPPVPTALVGAAGNATTLVPLVVGGDRLRAWWQARRTRRRAARNEPDPPAGPPTGPADADPGAAAARTDDDADARTDARTDDGADDGAAGRGGRARRLYTRYGLPGLALLGPLLTGVHVAALVGLAAGSPRRPTLVWLLGGVVLWAALAAAATVFGLDVLVDPDDLPDLLGLGS